MSHIVLLHVVTPDKSQVPASSVVVRLDMRVEGTYPWQIWGPDPQTLHRMSCLFPGLYCMF